MIVNFHMIKGEVSWDSSMHQFNGDILLRHIRVNSDLDDFDIELSYCEKTGVGAILNSKDQIIGNFFISY